MWKKLDEHLVYDGYRKIRRKTFLLPNGKKVDYETVGEGAVVCTLALTANNEIILAKQFRTGPEKVLMELPGGGLEADETPEQGGARELLEETGYTGTIQLIASTPTDAASCHLPLAPIAIPITSTDCDPNKETKQQYGEHPQDLFIPGPGRAGPAREVEDGYGIYE